MNEVKECSGNSMAIMAKVVCEDGRESASSQVVKPRSLTGNSPHQAGYTDPNTDNGIICKSANGDPEIIFYSNG